LARAVRDARLETRTARLKLTPQRKPYWKALTDGVHLGYRRGARAGKWVVRAYMGEGGYKTQTVATADDHIEANGEDVLTFAQAQDRARQVAENLAAQTGRTGPYTVADAVEDYDAEHMRAHGRGDGPRETWRIIRREILPALGSKVVADLTSKEIRKWLNAIAERPPADRSGNPRPADMADPAVRRRRQDSANRALRTLKAILNHAYREGRVARDTEWRRVKAFSATTQARTRWLTLDETRRLINAAQGSFRDLVRGALLTGARPGDLKRLRARDYMPEVGSVWFANRKAGSPYSCHLNPDGVALFNRLTTGRSGDDLIFTRDDGSPWGDDDHERPMRAASAGAGITPPATFYTLRHTYCSHAIMAGVPMLVVAQNVGHKDTRMIEQHYGHLADQYARDQIAQGVPSWGGGDDAGDDNVVGITEASR